MKIGTFLTGVVVLFGLYASAVCFGPADAQELQQIAASAAKSPDAKAAFVEYLLKNPSPNRLEAAEAKRLVNEVLVRDTARAVTGDPTIKTRSAPKGSPPEGASEESLIVFKLMIAVIFVIIMSAFLGLYIRTKDGRY